MSLFKTIQKTIACTFHWFPKLICLLPDETQLTHSVFNQELLSLIEIYQEGFKVTNPHEFSLTILSLDTVNLTYDTTTNKVLDISA